jgi:hypothetical protein
MLDDQTESAIFHAQFDINRRGLSGALNFLTMVTLYSTLIPISLYVSIEIVKYIQVGPIFYSLLFSLPCTSQVRYLSLEDLAHWSSYFYSALGPVDRDLLTCQFLISKQADF